MMAGELLAKELVITPRRRSIRNLHNKWARAMQRELHVAMEEALVPVWSEPPNDASSPSGAISTTTDVDSSPTLDARVENTGS